MLFWFARVCVCLCVFFWRVIAILFFFFIFGLCVPWIFPSVLCCAVLCVCRAVQVVLGKGAYVLCVVVIVQLMDTIWFCLLGFAVAFKKLAMMVDSAKKLHCQPMKHCCSSFGRGATYRRINQCSSQSGRYTTPSFFLAMKVYLFAWTKIYIYIFSRCVDSKV